MSADHRWSDGEMRRAAAVDDDQVAAVWSGSRAKQALFQELMTMTATQDDRATRPHRQTSRPHRSPRRRLAVLIAATLAFAALASGAVAAGVFAPDPADVQAVLDQRDPEIFLPGTRTELEAETVICVYPDGQVDDVRGAPRDGAADTVQTTASNGPLDALLTVDDLVTECATGTDFGTLDPGTATVCAVPDDAVGTPVVVGTGQDCATAGYETTDTTALLEDINRRRGAEIQRRGQATATPGP